MPYVSYPAQQIQRSDVSGLGWYPDQRKKRKLKKHKDQAFAGMVAAKAKFDKAVIKAESLEGDAVMLAQEAEQISELLLARGISIQKQKEIMAGLVKVPGMKVVKEPTRKVALKHLVKR